jgi:hypothetical protein
VAVYTPSRKKGHTAIDTNVKKSVLTCSPGKKAEIGPTVVVCTSSRPDGLGPLPDGRHSRWPPVCVFLDPNKREMAKKNLVCVPALQQQPWILVPNKVAFVRISFGWGKLLYNSKMS